MKYIQDNARGLDGSLIVDAGNLFVYGREFNPQQKDNPEVVKKAVARAEVFAEVYARMKTQGIAVGGSDLALGVNTLKTLQQKHGIPLLSANLLDAGGKRVFPASRVVRVGGVAFGILGLTGTHPRWPQVADEGKLRLGDALVATRTEVQSLRAQGAQIVVLLAATGHPEASRIARELEGIDFVVVSGTGRHTPRPERQGKAWLVESAREGKYIGHLTLHIRSGKLQFEDMGERLTIAADLESMQKNLDSLEKNLPPDVAESRREWLTKRIDQLKKSMDSSRRLLHEANQRVPKESFLVSFMAACALTLPEDPAVAELIRTRAQAAGLQRPPGSH